MPEPGQRDISDRLLYVISFRSFELVQPAVYVIAALFHWLSSGSRLGGFLRAAFWRRGQR
jgi:hypothetical protein